MEMLKKSALFAWQVAAMLMLCVVVSAVLGLAFEAIYWIGSQAGVWDYMQGGVAWFNALPWVPTVDSWIRATGISPGWLGYLFSLVILGALGVFRGRK